jgi:hypothetical protein
MSGLKYSSIILAAVLLSGCGKETTPEPPLTQPELVLQILKDAKAKKREAACNKLDRLIALDKNNAFLHELKSSEQNNIYIENIQTLLDKNDLDGAIKEIDNAELKLGRNPQLNDAREKLEYIKKISVLSKSIADPANGMQLEKDCIAMKKLIANYKPAEKYLPILTQKIELAQLLQKQEEKRTVFSIFSDMLYFQQTGNPRLAKITDAELDLIASDEYPRERVQSIAKQLNTKTNETKTVKPQN